MTGPTEHERRYQAAVEFNHFRDLGLNTLVRFYKFLGEFDGKDSISPAWDGPLVGSYSRRTHKFFFVEDREKADSLAKYLEQLDFVEKVHVDEILRHKGLEIQYRLSDVMDRGRVGDGESARNRGF